MSIVEKQKLRKEFNEIDIVKEKNLKNDVSMNEVEATMYQMILLPIKILLHQQIDRGKSSRYNYDAQ